MTLRIIKNIKCICGNILDESLRFSDKCFYLQSVGNPNRLYCKCIKTNVEYEILFTGVKK